MRAELLLAQPNIGRWMRFALQVVAGGAGLYSVVLALALWNMNVTLKREQTALKTTRRHAAEARIVRRRKQAEASAAGIVHVAPPAESGTAEFTQEVYRLASASGTGILSVVFTTPAPTAPPPVAEENANVNPGGNTNDGSNNIAGNAPNSNAPVASAPASAGDDWKRAGFECNVTGSFPMLQDFLERLTRLPRVVEISSLEFHRDRVDARTGAVSVHLKLTGSVFGQAGKP